ncbi:hypothetical protein D3C71_249890 [compost metagenome]
MASRSECEALEAMERAGRRREAFVFAMSLIERDEGDDTGRVFSAIERAAEHFADAALTAAMSHKIFNRAESRPGAVATFFEMAIAGDDDKVRRMATFGLSRHLLEKGDAERGIKLMKMARRLGYPEASAELGLFHEKGAFGLPVDTDKAVECYVEAVEGESALAMYQLAQHMLSNTVKVRDYHPLELLQRSASLGYPEAVALVGQMAEAIEALEEAEAVEDMLPYVVVPDGLDRIRLVRDAMVHEFSVGEDEAGSCTAALMGYPGWDAMAADATSEAKAKGKFDEDCTAAEFNERERLQTEIFSGRTGASQSAALTAIKLLRPSSRTVKPSLRRFDRIMDGSITKAFTPEINEMVTNVLEQMGMPKGGDPDQALRTLWPLKVKTWLDVFEDHGWSMRRRRHDATEDGEMVAVSETSDGRLFKIFMSIVAFDPGDLGDEHVEAIMNRIADGCERAILIFNHPRVSPIRGSETRGAFYGGRILSNGTWSDFLLRKSDGIEDALRQHVQGIDVQSPAVTTEFAFEGAVELACRIAAAVTDQKSTEGFGLIHSPSNWSSPVPAAAMSAARLMKEVGSIIGD